MTRVGTILAIMTGLIVWGAVHAYGAYLMNHNPMRGLVIGIFSGGFLAFWGMLLVWKWDRLRSRRPAAPSAGPVSPEGPSGGSSPALPGQAESR